MIFEIFAVVLVLGLVGWGAWRLYLLQIGVRYAKARKMQSLAIVAGLGAALAVIVAAVVSGDSVAVQFAEEAEARTGGVDLAVDLSHGRSFPELRQAIFDASPDVEGVAPYSASFGSMDALGGSNIDTMWLVIVDEGYEDVVDWETLDGDDWDGGVALTRSTARDLRSGVGDQVDFFPNFHFEQRSFDEVPVNTTLDGHWQLAYANPTGGFAHADEDVYRFEYEVTKNITQLQVTLDVPVTAAHAGETLVLTAPNGTTYEAQDRIDLDPRQQYLPRGTWVIEAHDSGAANVDFTVHVTAMHGVGVPHWDDSVVEEFHITLPVRAVVADSAFPDDFFASAIVRIDQAIASGLIDDEPGAYRAFVRLAPGADPGAASDQIIRALGLEDEFRPVTDLAAENAERTELRRLAGMLLWSIVGGMTLAAGLALIFVLMALLIEERRGTLAALRTTGATVGAMSRMHLAEAGVYAVAALLPALLLGILMAGVFDLPLFGEEDLDLVVRPIALLAAMGLAVGLVLVSGWFAATRTGRLHLASALRGEDRPARAATWPRAVGVAVLGVLGLGLLPGAIQGAPFSLTVAPSCLIIAVAGLLGFWLSRHVVYPLAGAALLVWLVISRSVISDIDTAREALLLPGRALMFCAAAAMLFVYSRWLHAALSYPFRKTRWGAPLEVALAYLRGRPGRVALSMFVISMILLGVTFLGALAPAGAESPFFSLGGYDAVGYTVTPVGDFATAAAAGTEPLANVERWVQVDFLPNPGFIYSDVAGSSGGRGGSIAAVDPTLFNTGALYTVAGLSTEDAVQRLMDEPGTIIVSEGWQHEWEPGYGVGTTGTIVDADDFGSEGYPIKIIAHMNQVGWDMPQVWASPETIRAISQTTSTAIVDAIFVEGKAGVDPEELALEVELGYPDAGLRMYAREVDTMTPRLVQMFSTFTLLTLTIGAIALGLITARNAAIRRRQIGALRALGAQQTAVVGMVMLETVYVVVVATVVGVLGAWLSLVGLGTQLPYDIPWGWTVSLGLYAVAAAAVAGALPAWLAAKQDPAAAARYVE